MFHIIPSCFPSPFLNTNHMTRMLPCLSYRNCLKACNSHPCNLQERVTVKAVATINGDINPTEVADLHAQLAWIYWPWADSKMPLGSLFFICLLLPMLTAFRKNSIFFFPSLSCIPKTGQVNHFLNMELNLNVFLCKNLVLITQKRLLVP